MPYFAEWILSVCWDMIFLKFISVYYIDFFLNVNSNLHSLYVSGLDLLKFCFRIFQCIFMQANALLFWLDNLVCFLSGNTSLIEWTWEIFTLQFSMLLYSGFIKHLGQSLSFIFPIRSLLSFLLICTLLLLSAIL